MMNLVYWLISACVCVCVYYIAVWILQNNKQHAAITHNPLHSGMALWVVLHKSQSDCAAKVKKTKYECL